MAVLMLDCRAWIIGGNSQPTAPTFDPTVGSIPRQGGGLSGSALRTNTARRKWSPTCPVRASEAPGAVDARIATVYCLTQDRYGLGSRRNI
jgi:hypothetical protein